MQKKGVEKVPHCTICAHEDREGIEIVGLLASATANLQTRRINNTFGTNFTKETVRRHFTEHRLTPTAARFAESIGDDPNSIEGAMGKLLANAVLDINRGYIKIKTPREFSDVAQVLANLRRSQDMNLGMESGDAASFYAAMAAYGEAMKSVVSKEQMEAIVRRANALGAQFNIGNIPLPRPELDGLEDALQQCVDDHVTLGRGRSRRELVEAGVIEAEVDVYDTLDDLDLGLDSDL